MAASQRRAVLPPLPENSCLPSAENATEVTKPVFPVGASKQPRDQERSNPVARILIDNSAQLVVSEVPFLIWQQDVAPNRSPDKSSSIGQLTVTRRYDEWRQHIFKQKITEFKSGCQFGGYCCNRTSLCELL
jgi:hypothetical protein